MPHLGSSCNFSTKPLPMLRDCSKRTSLFVEYPTKTSRHEKRSENRMHHLPPFARSQPRGSRALPAGGGFGCCRDGSCKDVAIHSNTPRPRPATPRPEHHTITHTAVRCSFDAQGCCLAWACGVGRLLVGTISKLPPRFQAINCFGVLLESCTERRVGPPGARPARPAAGDSHASAAENLESQDLGPGFPCTRASNPAPDAAFSLSQIDTRLLCSASARWPSTRISASGNTFHGTTLRRVVKSCSALDAFQTIPKNLDMRHTAKTEPSSTKPIQPHSLHATLPCRIQNPSSRPARANLAVFHYVCYSPEIECLSPGYCLHIPAAPAVCQAGVPLADFRTRQLPEGCLQGLLLISLACCFTRGCAVLTPSC